VTTASTPGHRRALVLPTTGDDVLPDPVGVPSTHSRGVDLLIGTTLEEANLGSVPTSSPPSTRMTRSRAGRHLPRCRSAPRTTRSPRPGRPPRKHSQPPTRI
jgi:hypothetical protein